MRAGSALLRIVIAESSWLAAIIAAISKWLSSTANQTPIAFTSSANSHSFDSTRPCIHVTRQHETDNTGTTKPDPQPPRIQYIHTCTSSLQIYYLHIRIVFPSTHLRNDGTIINDRPKENEYHRASRHRSPSFLRTIPILIMDLDPAIPGPSSKRDRYIPKCCCGHAECAYLDYNNAALEGLENDLATAAQLGQVNLTCLCLPISSFFPHRGSRHSFSMAELSSCLPVVA